MKTIDTKSLLIGILATVLFFSLTSWKTPQDENNIDFVASPLGVGIYNKVTKTIYMYETTGRGAGISQIPSNTYIVGSDGSYLTKK
jgi:hypothetical protein